jgi:hypothetical protein
MLTQAVTRLSCIREVRSSNLGGKKTIPTEKSYGLVQFLQDNSELCHNRVFPRPFQFMVHYYQIIRHSIIPITLSFFYGVGLSPLGIAATSGLLYKPQILDIFIHLILVKGT